MRWDGRSIMRKALDNFAQAIGLLNSIPITRANAPVKMVLDDRVPSVDIAICSRSGYWSPYRDWPSFPRLKVLLTDAKLRWHDLSESGIRGNECLNYVRKAKLYLGLETGMSHFVSSVARRGLILQSGYSCFEYWSTYGYSYLCRHVACSPCFLTHVNECPHMHRCMTEITAEMVLQAILCELGKPERT